MAKPREERRLVIVDGRSGAGKTQWASQLARESGFFLLSLDELYPGWDGLDAGHWLAYTRVVVPWRAGEVSRVRRWDWESMAPGEVIEISPRVDLVIEGCGALSNYTAPLADSRYWLEADSDVRKTRALLRDGEMFSPHWQRWALQEERFMALHASPHLADSVIHT